MDGSIAYIPAPQQTEDLYYLADSMNGYGLDYWPPHVSEIPIAPVGAVLTNTSPVTISTTVITPGSILNSYLQDFYYRFHLNIYNLDLGNILSDQQYTLEIWNSHFESQDLLAISETELDNISLSLGITIPKTFTALSYVSGDILVEKLGDSTIDGFYTFAFTSETIFLNIQGNRTILWPYVPLTQHSETYSYLTDVIKANSKETRYSLRDVTRTKLRYTYIFKNQEIFGSAINLAKVAANIPIATPLWSDVTKVINLSLGQTIINIDTRYMEFALNELVLIYSSPTKYDITEIIGLTASSITIKVGLLNEYSSAAIIPVRIGYAEGGVNFNQSVGKVPKANISYMIARNRYVNDYSPSETFETIPVIDTPAIISKGLSSQIARNIEMFDSEVGDFIAFDAEKYTRHKQIITGKGQTPKEKYDIRRFLDYTKGQYNPFWLPSYNKNLNIVGTVSTGVSSIRVEHANWSLYPAKAIRVVGEITACFNIVSVTDNLDGTESLQVSPAPTADINNVKRIEILTKSRLGTDNIELIHANGYISFSATTIEIL